MEAIEAIGAIGAATGPAVLAHVGALGEHDLFVIIPMAILSALVMIVMARPKQPPPSDDGEHPAPDRALRDGHPADPSRTPPDRS